MEKLPQKSGMLLRLEQLESLLDGPQNAGWLAFLPEDFLAMGGESHHHLGKLCAQYPLSMLADGLSIGSAESVNEQHLNNIKSLCERYGPCNITTAMSWCRWQGTYLGGNQPLPYTVETLDQATFNLHAIQNSLGRRILVANTAQYLNFQVEQLEESQFFEELVRNSGCGMVLDLTSLYASAINNSRDPFKTLRDFPLAAVKEIHLSGHSLMRLSDDEVLVVADQQSAVSRPVWQLYRESLTLLPRPVATLIKWRGDQVKLEDLQQDMRKADSIIESHNGGKSRGLA